MYLKVVYFIIRNNRKSILCISMQIQSIRIIRKRKQIGALIIRVVKLMHYKSY